MSNIIRLNETAPNDDWIVMSNQGTDCFLDLLIIAADGFEKTEHQKELISFLMDRKNVNDIAPGTAGFDLDEMPWHAGTLKEDAGFLLRVAAEAQSGRSFRKLFYEADADIVLPWLERFADLVKRVNSEVSITVRLEPVTDDNREAVLALTVREDQPFVATNGYSLREADEANARAPGTARPFAIYAGEKLVGFCMLALDPEDENPADRYCLWRFMIDRSEQGKGYGQAALQEIIRYFRENGVDAVYLSTAPENEIGLHVYHKAGFRETGGMEEGEATLALKL